MDSTTLVAGVDDGGLPSELRTTDGRFRVSAQVWDEGDNGIFLHVRAYLADRDPSPCYYHLLVDGEGGLEASAIGSTEDEAGRLLLLRVREEVDMQFTTDAHWLERSNGSPSVIGALNGRVELRAKAHVPVGEDEDPGASLLRLRVHTVDFGHFQIVMQAYGRLVPVGDDGRTDHEAYDRLRSALARRGIEID